MNRFHFCVSIYLVLVCVYIVACVGFDSCFGVRSYRKKERGRRRRFNEWNVERMKRSFGFQKRKKYVSIGAWGSSRGLWEV